jgi:hypothetical protein
MLFELIQCSERNSPSIWTWVPGEHTSFLSWQNGELFWRHLNYQVNTKQQTPSCKKIAWTMDHKYYSLPFMYIG